MLSLAGLARTACKWNQYGYKELAGIEKDKLIKEREVGQKRPVWFLSQNPYHQRVPGPWTPANGSAVWPA